ncbi:MAG TPA: hypothetical protein VE592_00330 [Geminicoccaceae bacterium]|nr:hypothetical protein [Geminicoccaceae bacterium]
MTSASSARDCGCAESESVAPPPALADAVGVPCCPQLETDRSCDALDFHYRLIHTATVNVDNQPRRVPVEVILHARLERCPGPLALGDLVYSTTLLPGEKVRLFSTDRRTRFSLDSATSVSYRREQTSEERYFMSSMSDFMSDLTVRDEARSANQQRGSFETHGETNGAIQAFFAGPSIDVSGSYNAESTSDFLRELNQHARASSERSVEATRAASSVSVGEVQSRSHAEGESEDHFESASRVFANPNRCHAVTFYFYQINKTQTVRLTLETIRRRVIDPAGDTRIANNPFASRGEVSVIPSAVLATDKERLELEQIGRSSVAAAQAGTIATGSQTLVANRLSATSFAVAQPVEPLPAAVRAQALAAVDADLAAAGLIDPETGEATDEVKASFTFETTSSLPTPGMLVRGCLDACDICEPAVMREIELDLERKALENELLKRRIEILHRAQEYRCCPAEAPVEDA